MKSQHTPLDTRVGFAVKINSALIEFNDLPLTRLHERTNDDLRFTDTPLSKSCQASAQYSTIVAHLFNQYFPISLQSCYKKRERF